MKIKTKLKQRNNYHHKKWDESLLKGNPDFESYKRHRYYERLLDNIELDPISRLSSKHVYYLANKDTEKVKSQFQKG